MKYLIAILAAFVGLSLMGTTADAGDCYVGGYRYPVRTYRVARPINTYNYHTSYQTHFHNYPSVHSHYRLPTIYGAVQNRNFGHFRNDCYNGVCYEPTTGVTRATSAFGTRAVEFGGQYGRIDTRGNFGDFGLYVDSTQLRRQYLLQQAITLGVADDFIHATRLDIDDEAELRARIRGAVSTLRDATLLTPFVNPLGPQVHSGY